MLASFYLDLLEHVHTSRKTPEMISKKFMDWKEHHMSIMRKENEERQHYINTVEVPDKEKKERYQSFLEESERLKQKYNKSSVDKQQASLEEWLQYQNDGIQELINISKE